MTSSAAQNVLRPRSRVLSLATLALAVSISSPLAAAPSHGVSAFGELKYPKDFAHFAYVNPEAPKGGRLSMIGTAARTTFDSFNEFIVKGVRAQGLALLYDTLLTRAWDEPDAAYGLLARAVERAPDDKSVTFYLRKDARFADGKPVTAADVVFSFETLSDPIKAHPIYATPLRDIASAEAVDPQTVRFTYKPDRQTRDLPQRVGAMPILASHWVKANDFTKSGLNKPVGSGPYEIADFKQGRYVTYRRRADYWAADLNVNRGRWNFEELRYEYFRDRNAELEALKSGEFLLREEFTSRTWATAYDIAQVRDGRMIKEELPDLSPSGSQGFFFNTRKKKFSDPRIREALGYAFDFEWTRKTLFFGAYERTHSYFENSSMRADGPPSPAELKLLEPYRNKLPARVFETAIVPPVSNASGADRTLLRKSRKLLKDAGVTFDSGKATLPDGTPLDVEFLIFAQGFERIIAPFVQNLKRIGVPAKISRIDPTAYELRKQTFDYDVIVQRLVSSSVPGPELRNFFGSEAAGQNGSFNLSGIRDPIVDALISNVLKATGRSELETATRALDRVLRAGFYWVPNWFNKTHRMAYWNVFSRPAIKPAFNRGIIQTWWRDDEKAARIGK